MTASRALLPANDAAFQESQCFDCSTLEFPVYPTMVKVHNTFHMLMA